MPYQVSQLLKDLGEPVSAVADEPLRDALDRMLHYRFSQLPVVKGTGQFYFITHESILVALHNFGSRIEGSGLRVDDALVKSPTVYRATDDLFDLLLGMREMGAALIVGDDGKLTHVVTSYDTSQYFRQWAEDTMQVRDVEHALRRIINAAFRRSDGDIDLQARQSAVQELTSANRALRKKFSVALKHYISQRSSKAPVLRPELVDLAFVELLKQCKAATITDTTESIGHEDGWAPARNVAGESSELSRLLATSQALRDRFEAVLQFYLTQHRNDVGLDDALIDDAFKIVYDRAEQVKEFGDLTLGDYIQLFFRGACWGRCKDVIRLTEEEVKHMLEGVRDTRNMLAHFRDEEITAQKRLQLKRCADWLSDREKLIVAAFGRAEAI